MTFVIFTQSITVYLETINALEGTNINHHFVLQTSETCLHYYSDDYIFLFTKQKKNMTNMSASEKHDLHLRKIPKFGSSKIYVVQPGIEPGTSRVLGERDNHYTTEPWGEN